MVCTVYIRSSKDSTPGTFIIFSLFRSVFQQFISLLIYNLNELLTFIHELRNRSEQQQQQKRSLMSARIAQSVKRLKQSTA